MEELLLPLLHEEGSNASPNTIETVLLLSAVEPEHPIIPDLRFCLVELTNADSELLFHFDINGC